MDISKICKIQKSVFVESFQKLKEEITNTPLPIDTNRSEVKTP